MAMKHIYSRPSQLSNLRSMRFLFPPRAFGLTIKLRTEAEMITHSQEGLPPSD
jgi:hypothetical protein